MSEAQILAWLTSQPIDRVRWSISSNALGFQIELVVTVGKQGDDVKVWATGDTLVEAWEKLQGKAATFHAALRREATV